MKLYDFDGMFDEKLADYLKRTRVSTRRASGKILSPRFTKNSVTRL